jgi:HK97 family phage major capsid protein
LHSFFKAGGKSHGEELMAGADGQGGYHIPGSESYTRQRGANGAFPTMNAATYEGTEGGSNGAGGYAISVPTWDIITPLALPDLGIFDASLVIPTETDIKIPSAASFGTSTLKSESTGTIATFGGTDPTLGQTALTAFMAGALRLTSWELIQDVKAFQSFIVDDLIKGQRILEGSLLATGTGSGEALGVFGNTGTGTGAAYELTGTALSDGLLLLQALFDVTATLKGQYQAGASFIMSRATGLAIRRAQMQSNLYIPIATTDPDGTERILGKPVFYDVNAPALPTATNAGVVPILYGDFKQGYIVGVRGGAGINVKILDQPWAAQGQLGILAYRRLDGRVRRSEAIQAVTVSHS